MGSHFLDPLFTPKSIAVFGASERSEAVAGRVYDNLRKSGYTGPIYPINPKHKKLFKEPCYPSITDIARPVDLAVIATPAATVPEIVHACGEHGVRAAIIISAGFNEGDNRGSALKKSILETARQYNMRILGPNCLGLISTVCGMNATFSKNTAKPGNLALVSQSGALCTAILDWAIANDVGFSSIASLGDAADIDFGDILNYLAQDRHTDSILLYIEGIRHSRRFMSGLRIAARMKPVVVIKAGRHVEGSLAATTHTGAMVGDDDVFDAALQRAGVVRVLTIEQLFAAAQLLSNADRVNGNRLAIVTNGGGLGVMATDRAIDLGVQIAALSDDTVARLNAVLPAQWSHSNPVDILGDASAERYHDAVKACLLDPDVDGILVMLSPQAMTDVEACAQAIIDAHNINSKPVLTCWMGEEQVEPANKLFSKHHVPTFPNPESCVEAFSYLASYYQNQKLLMQVPGPLATHKEPDVEGARLIIDSVLAEKRNILSITESKALLHAFDIPVTQSIVCTSANNALVAAESLGFPVAMKIYSRDITHKTDVGGIRLNISNARAVRSTFHEIIDEVKSKYPDSDIEGVTIEPMYTPDHERELLIGVISDPVFGPVITFGSGGIHVEILRDRAVSLPPLNKMLIEKMISQTQISKMLGKFRNMPAVDMKALVQVLCNISELVCELPEVKELDINPLIADQSGVMALDARIVVAHPAPSLNRYGHMAIHPYPSHLVSHFQLADGTNIKIRPIRPEDASIEQSFVRGLSERSRYFRFMQGINELTQEMLVRFTQLDYNRELALIAIFEEDGIETVIGVARYVMNPDGSSCEFALVVADKWQNKSIGTRLMNVLLDAAQQRGIRRMESEILASNNPMLKLTAGLGFDIKICPEDSGIRLASKRL
jgi:acetyltransferase